MIHKRQGYGSAEYWLQNHNITLKRYLRTFYSRYDWKVMKYFFLQNPIQAKVILEDFKKSNDNKLKEVVKIFTDGKSKIIYIVGGRGSGKTATAFMIAEVSNIKTRQKIYYVGDEVDKSALPFWCVHVRHIKDAPNGCLAIIDESGIQFNAREYRDKGNIEMSKQLMIARHKDISLIFLTQHTALSDTNIQRLRDLVIWKMSNDYTPAEKGTARSREHQFWKKVRIMMSPRAKNQCLFEYPMIRRFIHFSHPLPECWSEALSKTWRKREFKEYKILERKEKMDLIEEIINE